ncbi:hypothetical protein LCGC14_2266370 [marine sediment metagenome]|uniref:DUF1737 domain-containing protein n=1 Tax=marine sediment metagenome TaxID=412755 RepID=A0A0F9DKI3_9ZZZZ
MVEYTICLGYSMPDLVLDVNKAIKGGWNPIGGIAVDFEIDKSNIGMERSLYYQAMIKEDRKLFAEKLKAAKRKGWTLDEAIANTMDETLEEANAEES